MNNAQKPLQSMTGYGSSTIDAYGSKLSVEIRCLNSKLLDLNIRLPQGLRAYEQEIRKTVSQRLHRGKIDVSVYQERQDAAEESIFCTPQIKAYYHQLLTLCRQEELPLPTDPMSYILSLPGSLLLDQDLSDEEGRYKLPLQACLDEALKGVEAFRLQEGSMTASKIRTSIEQISEALQEVEQPENQRIERIRERIEQSLRRLQQPEIDAGRLEQELVYYIEKLDISEEKTRLQNHLSYFLESMEEDASGKKLNFIAQEIGREINTLGSKANDAQMQRIVVRMKDEIEKIKEQVLNLL